MAIYTTVRAMVRTDVADTARIKAETEGKTLAEKVAELLEAYAAARPAAKRRKATK